MKNNGKKTNYIDSNFFVSNDSNQLVDTNAYAASAIPDSIRYFSKNYFVLGEGIIKEAEKQNNLFFVEKNDKNLLTLKANKEKFEVEALENGIRTKKFNSSNWLKFIESVIPDQNQIFQDFKVELPELTDVASIENRIEIGTSVINFEFIYNFISKKFETLTSSPVFNTNVLPNIFNLIGDKKTDLRTEQENTILTLGGYIEPNLVDAISLANKPSEQLSKYFDKYTEAYRKQETSIAKVASIELQKDTKLTKEKINFINKINFVPFPFYADMQFTNFASSKDDFTHKIENIGKFEDDFITYFLNSSATDNFLENNYIANGTETKIKFFDLVDFLRSNLGLLQDEQTTISINKSIKYSNLVNFINKNYSSKNRDYSGLNSSSTAEPIIYKIEKIETSISQTPIQTFWISPNQESVIRLIDTQIKYGNQYKYKIYAYFLIFGTQYSYLPYSYNQLEKIKDIANGEYKLNIEQKSVYKIGEFLISEINGGVYEAPYTKPSIKLFQENSNIRFVINDSSQEELEEYDILETNEYKVFENIRISQNNDEKQKIKFKKNPNSFSNLQIYRTTVKPKNYLSFQGKLFKNISLKDNQNSFLDAVFPNQKYYYTFRYLNEHGVPSNPSIVYEILLEEQDGFYSLKQSMLDLKKPPNKILEKNMKKYLLIRPSVIQTQPNYKKEFETIDDVDLGPEKEKTWQKPFVIKLTSKKTNKTLVFNITPTIIRKK